MQKSIFIIFAAPVHERVKLFLPDNNVKKVTNL
mgnify:CR=1 FL=1